MKDFRYLILLLLLIPFVAVNGNNNLQWQYDGTVKRDDGKTFKLNLQNVYHAMYHDKELFVLGYRIDKKGINYPYTARVSYTLDDAEYWESKTGLKDLFVYQSGVHLVDSAGVVKKYQDHAWTESKIKLKPGSVVVYSNGDIIACKPSPLFKTDKTSGECYSISNKWAVKLSWRKVKPKVCDKVLYVITKENNKTWLMRLNLKNGELMEKKPVSHITKDVCTLNAGR